MTQIIYRVDGKDQITSVNSEQVNFGLENGMTARSARDVIGTRLWQHLSDMTARHFYKVFMNKVRKTGESIRVPFRQDSPTSCRFMEMTIVKMENDELEFTSVLCREEAKAGVDKIEAVELLIMCLWCHKVKVTGWLEPEQAVKELRIFEKAQLPMITHSICPQCNIEGFGAVH